MKKSILTFTTLIILGGVLVYGQKIKPSTTKAEKNTECSLAVRSQEHAYENDRYRLTETFDKYPVQVYDGPLAILNTKISSSDARKFETRINEELSKTGINFAGKYSIVSVGMTGWGQNYFLVDRITGKGVIIPYSMTYFDSRENSSLLVINPKHLLVEDPCSSTGGSDYYVDLRPYYYNWDGKTFNQIGDAAPSNQFWES